MSGSGNIIRNNIFYNNTTNISVGSNNTLGHNLTTDPQFINLSLRNYTLKAGSSAIDAGFDVGQSFNGKAPDIGAIEY